MNPTLPPLLIALGCLGSCLGPREVGAGREGPHLTSSELEALLARSRTQATLPSAKLLAAARAYEMDRLAALRAARELSRASGEERASEWSKEAPQASDDPPRSAPQPAEVRDPAFGLVTRTGAAAWLYDDDGDGRIDRLMKAYSFHLGGAAEIVALYKDYCEDPGLRVLTDGLLDGKRLETLEPATGSLELDIHRGGIVEYAVDPKALALNDTAPVALGDRLFARGTPADLRDFETFLEHLGAGGRRQVEVEIKVVEVSTSDIVSVGIIPSEEGVPIASLPGTSFLKAVEYGFTNAVEYGFTNGVGDGEALLSLHSVHDGLELNATLEALERRDGVSIITRPKFAVREGARGQIINTVSIPYYHIGGLSKSAGYSGTLAYRDTGVRFYALPRVLGDGTIALQVELDITQDSGFSVNFRSVIESVIRTPIIAGEHASTTLYLRPGQAALLGGILSKRDRLVERGIPLLGRLPLIGSLFSSREYVEDRNYVLFFIRARVL